MIVHIKDERSGNMLCDIDNDGWSFRHSECADEITCKDCIDKKLIEDMEDVKSLSILDRIAIKMCKWGLHNYSIKRDRNINLYGHKTKNRYNKECSCCGAVVSICGIHVTKVRKGKYEQ